jgi:ParB family chromosome partitioning protein
MKKKPLGRGLEALIPKAENKTTVIELDINDIVPNRDQPRHFFDDESLAELASSIKEHGVIQPILVTKEHNKYKIIAGERRFRAAQQIKLERIPAIIVEVTSENQVIEIGLIENLQRENLNPIEVAMAYKQLIEKFQYSQDSLSKVVGKSRSAVANTLRLLNLPDEVLEALGKNIITEGHARALLSLVDKKSIMDVYKKIVDNSLSVRETENLIKKLKNNKVHKGEVPSTFSPFKKDIEEEFENYFNTKVMISGEFHKGTIKIIYKSKDDLHYIINKIRGNPC